MLKLAVLVSGGGTNLQAIIDGIADGTITNTEIGVVISNNPGAYALERAKKAGIPAVCVSPKSYADSTGRMSGGHTEDNDSGVPESDYQHSPVADTFLLRNWLLWPEGA